MNISTDRINKLPIVHYNRTFANIEISNEYAFYSSVALDHIIAFLCDEYHNVSKSLDARTGENFSNDLLNAVLTRANLDHEADIGLGINKLGAKGDLNEEQVNKLEADIANIKYIHKALGLRTTLFELFQASTGSNRVGDGYIKNATSNDRFMMLNNLS